MPHTPLSIKQVVNLSLDLWEMSRDFGTAPITPTMWAQRYYRGKAVKRDNVLRCWERLKRKIKDSPFHVDFVIVHEHIKVRSGEETHRIDGYCLNRTELSKTVAIQIPRGAYDTLTLILDNHAGVSNE